MQSSARAGHVVLPTHRDFGPPTNRLKKKFMFSLPATINQPTALRLPRAYDHHVAAMTTRLRRPRGMRPPRGGATRTDFARLRILSYNYRNTTFETRAPRVWGVLQPRGATSYIHDVASSVFFLLFLSPVAA